MDVVARLTIPLRADHQQPLTPGKRYTVVTIDDAFRSANDNAIPQLIKRKIPVAVFVSPDLLETTPEWITFDGDELGNEQVVSADVIKSWPKDLVTVGSHTLTHPWLPSSSEQDARAEVTESRSRLRELIGGDVRLFSFPYGASTDGLIQMCREAGYQRVFTSTPVLGFSDPYEFVSGRVKTEPTDWPLEFHLKVMGAYRWLPKAFALKRKLLRRAASPDVQTIVKPATSE
jgi:peptidoglycan/xylan/chitin deacetylase (PgdA/CDA1 family)